MHSYAGLYRFAYSLAKNEMQAADLTQHSIVGRRRGFATCDARKKWRYFQNWILSMIWSQISRSRL